MAVIDLPVTPGPASCRFLPVRFGMLLSPPNGGEEQQLNKLGDRWAVEVRLPRLTLAQAADWSTSIDLARRSGARWQLRQLGVAIGTPGTVLVAGAGQGGMALAVDGMTPWTGWSKGQFVSQITGGRRFLHRLAAAGHSTNGTATLNFTAPIRRSPADNDVIDFMPAIEGALTGAEGDWEIDEARLVTVPPFVIREKV